MGRRAREAIAAGEGALARHLAVLEARLGPGAARAGRGWVMGGFAAAVERAWTPRTPADRLLRACLVPASAVYGGAVWLRGALYDAGVVAIHAGAGPRGERRQPDGRGHRQDAGGALVGGGAARRAGGASRSSRADIASGAGASWWSV